MPEPLDRETFLRAVADSVDLQPAEVGDVLEELSSHLSDAARSWRDAGLDPEDAERRAVSGLGDPALLGRSLGEARHPRRQLLRAVGGSIFSAVWFGIWSWLFLWLFLGALAFAAAGLATSVLNALGRAYGSMLAGPVGSVGTLAVTGLWLGWLGWILPARVALRARRSVRGVRRAVGVLGFATLELVIWFGLRLTLDPVLALGLPLLPLAFVLASQNSSADLLVFPRTTVLRALVAIAATVIVIAAVAVLTAEPAREYAGDWEADTSAIGAAESSVPGLAAISRSGQSGYSASASGPQVVERSVFIGDAAQAAAFARLLPALRLEAWPASVQAHRLVFGAGPIAVTSVPSTPVGGDVELSMVVPMERQPSTVATLLIGIQQDGRRVVLDGPDFPVPTSPWQGTVLDWWLGPR